eukprot:gnl/TRDRNA2_/TRDRNA2_162289_c0_seq3.p1 gnl/TRDRNA2_/TRDRNA2_162289_c0~~gnl/TRDRNA2_/TRDRNA2_162289_c0_seq3.p1  ORF type:complete len:655 (-),score=128.58 gnl/TRDRNA2_/TRDRNA2_162289_c0_seq3:235-2199(-)
MAFNSQMPDQVHTSTARTRPCRPVPHTGSSAKNTWKTPTLVVLSLLSLVVVFVADYVLLGPVVGSKELATASGDKAGSGALTDKVGGLMDHLLVCCVAFLLFHCTRLMIRGQSAAGSSKKMPDNLLTSQSMSRTARSHDAAARATSPTAREAGSSGAASSSDLLEELIPAEPGICDTGWRADSSSCNLRIRDCAKRGDLQGATRWLQKMEATGLKPSVYSYNMVMSAYAKADHAAATEAWLQKMIAVGITPNAISYATVMYVHARHGNEKLVEEWMHKMLDAGIKPDTVCFNLLVSACGASGSKNGGRLESLIKEMEAQGVEASVQTYTALIDACAKNGDVAAAEKWFEQMLLTKVEPNVVSYSAMINACAKVSNIPRAEYWYNRMLEAGVTPNAWSYSTVIDACAKAGDLASAESWFLKAEKAGLNNDVVIYSGMINACGRVGDAERAESFFKQMQEHGIRPHVMAFAALARPYAYRGSWIEVERIAEEMSAAGVDSNEYFLYAQILAYGMGRPRQAGRAEEVFRDAVSQGFKVNEHVGRALRRAVGYNRCKELVQELCSPSQAERLLSRVGGHDSSDRAVSNSSVSSGGFEEPTAQEELDLLEDVDDSSAAAHRGSGAKSRGPGGGGAGERSRRGSNPAIRSGRAGQGRTWR